MNRVYLTINSAEYAKLLGISTKAARARIGKMAGASKIGSRWTAPILATEYAHIKGIKPESARKRKGAVRAPNATQAGQLLDDRLRKKIIDKLVRYANQRKRHNANTIADRMQYATTQQIAKLDRMTFNQWLTAVYASVNNDTDDWTGSDEHSILYYR